MRIIVGIATRGRKAILSETFLELAKHRRLPECIIIFPFGTNDLEHELLTTLPCPIEILSWEQGLPAQRNEIFKATKGEDAIVFVDDEFCPSRGHLASAKAILRREPNVVIGAGMLIEDGIKGPRFTGEQTWERLAAIATPEYVGSVRPELGGYAYNMLVRLASLHDNKIEFDETLPLYGWQADELSKVNAHQGRQRFQEMELPLSVLLRSQDKERPLVEKQEVRCDC